MSGCLHCGAELVQPHAGGRRLFCSNRCRKYHRYGGKCEVCGASTDGSNGPAAAPTRCFKHNTYFELRADRGRARAERALALRRQGLLNYEIAERLDSTPAAIAQLLCRRKLARYDLPFLPTPYEGPTKAIRERAAA